jgi:iron complex transport system substrate-binding protein
VRAVAPGLGGIALLVALTACGGGSGSGAAARTADTRTVTHDRGETEVPAEPQRVVVLDSPHLDAALSVGVTPVGSAQSSVDEGLPAYLGDRTEGIDIVGTIEEPDLEAIAALDPDLILSATVRHEQIYDQLS